MKYLKYMFRNGINVMTISTILSSFLYSQQSSNSEYPQYLFPEFSESEILLKDGQQQTELLNYNTVTEKIVCMQDDSPYDLMNTVLIDTVFMQNRKFVPYGKIFHEILVTGTYTLFLQNRSDLVPAGKPVGYGGTSQGVSSYYLSKHELAPEYINIQIPPDVRVEADPVFRILKEGDMLDFKNKKQFIALFPEKEDEIKNLIRKNRIKFDNTDDVINLINYINNQE